MRKTAMVGTLLCAALLSGCTSTIVGSASAPGQAGPGGGAAAGPPAPPKPQRPVIQLGDQYPVKDWKAAGAPFDNCTTLKWEDFPEATRNPKGTPPKLEAVEPTLPYTTDCQFDNSGTITFNPDSDAPPQGKVLFVVDVVWGPEFGPQSLKNSVPVTIAGKAGGMRESTFGAAKEPYCFVVVPLAKGGAGVEVRNGRFSDKATACDIAKGLTEKLLSRVQ
ncbi:DUF3558 family protein [Allokutzneria oryzae]|uniref:DUF3558 family protein n=1 Tax=Allokutzneria oryzae TaxID=1378989 RepID=A0ABV6A8Q0_9PSEU